MPTKTKTTSVVQMTSVMSLSRTARRLARALTGQPEREPSIPLPSVVGDPVAGSSSGDWAGSVCHRSRVTDSPGAVVAPTPIVTSAFRLVLIAVFARSPSTTPNFRQSVKAQPSERRVH